MKKEKKIIILISIIVLIVVSLTLLITFLFFPPPITRDKDVTLHIYVHFSDPVRLKNIGEEIELFTALEPRFHILLHNLPFSRLHRDFQSGELDPPADILVTSAPASYGKNTFLKEPIPWAGRLWILYYNKKALKTIGIDPENGKDEISLSFAAGEIGREELEETFSVLKEAGITPITLGAQYGWPLAAWIQHLTAFEGGITEAKEMLSDSFDIASPAAHRALQDFSSFIEKGWVWEEYLAKDWPGALKPLIEGKAAFCLLSENLVTSIPWEKRSEIGFLPFPGSASGGQTRWAVGSLIYLGIPADVESPKDTQKVLDFLTSPGTTERLSKSLLLPFFSFESASRPEKKNFLKPSRLIPSITSRTDSPVIREIKREIDKVTRNPE